jgi:hypothetical protein
MDGQDVCPEPLEERRKRLAKLLSRKTKAMRDGIQLSQAITRDGARIFRHACWMDLEGCFKAHWLAIRQRPAGMAEDEEPGFGRSGIVAAKTSIISSGGCAAIRWPPHKRQNFRWLNSVFA